VAAGGLLHYFIFYENDPQATAPAIDVRITDELDPGLDETTLSMISNGGLYDPVTRTITWELTGIKLAPGDGGHVEFFVQTLPGLAPGTVVEDQASIVFDFNPPVLTPPTVHVIAEPVDTSAPRMHPCFDPPLVWPPNHKRGEQRARAGERLWQQGAGLDRAGDRPGDRHGGAGAAVREV
jgi:hypothetical protein